MNRDTSSAPRRRLLRYLLSGIAAVFTLPVLGDVGCARRDDAKSTLRAGLEPRELGVSERTIGMALRVGQRRNGDPVARTAAIPECYRLEERFHPGTLHEPSTLADEG